MVCERSHSENPLEMQMANSRSSVIRACLVVLSAFALAACGALGSQANEVDPAYLQFQGITSTIIVADTVPHGQFFVVSFNTFGGGCTNQVAGDDVSITGSEIDINPTNRAVAAANCSTDVINLMHSVNVTVPTAGTWTIKVTGLTDQASTGSTNNLFTIQITLIAK